jgi:uncharacterized protein (TIGR02001 family)
VKLTATKTTILAALAFSSAAFAQTKAPEPDYTLAYSVAAVTDYRFRGISQSRLKPALQASIDFTHKSGFYLGFWGSTIRILKDVPGGNGPLELDFFGGYRGNFTEALAYDIGLLRYQYPRQNFNPTVNTTELYGALTYGPATVKYSNSLGNETFGVGNSRNSYYLEAAATFDVGNGFSITPHLGRQHFTHGNGAASYTDYSLSLGKDFGNGFSGSAGLYGTNAGAFYTTAPTAGSKDLGKNGLVLGVKYAF